MNMLTPVAIYVIFMQQVYLKPHDIDHLNDNCDKIQVRSVTDDKQKITKNKIL